MTETKTEVAIVAAGCFWCVEPIFDELQGVISAESGYIGGHVEHPNYRAVCEGVTGHAEAIKIEFDPAQISFDTLLDIFFDVHDPTQINRQGNDVGTQYRTAIFPISEEQAEAAYQAIARNQPNFLSPIATTVEPFHKWWPAEDYHQRYFYREGDSNPYCMMVSAPKIMKFRKAYADRLKSAVAR